MLRFMSSEHVRAMNDRLGSSPEMAQACAALDRSYTVTYRLSDGPDGADVHWTVRLTPSEVVFSLETAGDADVCFVDSYRRMVDAAESARQGEAVATPAPTGDPAAVATVAPVFAVAAGVATLDVEFPR